ncbi:MAG TPA: trypsin-like peptidase domain-containing protein [Gemmatimonadales bacterium]|nr:trypsin-like peptidase domain-containing protein [Gemmatimonadales bacterium]
MKLQLRVLQGARAGAGGVFSQARVTVGRHPSADLQLDPERDLDVSARHAEFAFTEGRWRVRDLGSSNGTLVNGHRITAATALDDTDQIRLGENGPALEVRLVPDAMPDRRPEPAAAGAPTGPRPLRATDPMLPADVPAPEPRRASTTQRIRVEVGRQTKRLRLVSAALLVVLVVVVVAFLVNSRREARERARQVAALQTRIDSVLAISDTALASLKGQVEGLATALKRSRADVERLQQQLRSAQQQGDGERVALLERQLAQASEALRGQQTAAGIDYAAIDRANERAVALIWVEFAPGQVYTGTAFAVTPDGKLVTNRHVVADTSGKRRPTRIAVQFANSSQVWRARLLATSDSADLALVQVLGIAGNVPVVQGVDSAVTVETGAPVAAIGFPLGVDLAFRAEGPSKIVRTSFTAGLVSKVLPDLVQIDGYGAPGASGSPIFDAHGNLISVMYGGERDSNGRIVFSVPVRFVRALLRQAR